MKLSIYKKLFEKEFEENIKPSKHFYSFIKNSENKYFYPIEKGKFHFQSPPMMADVKEGKIDVLVEPHDIKKLYLSYLTLDTDFANVPDHSFVNIESLEYFYIDIDIATSSNVEVIPFIIHYDEMGKKRMTRITRRNQLVKISDDESKVRLTFKIKGDGKFTIKSITRIN